MMPNFSAAPSTQKPMSTGLFTALTPQNRPLDFQKTQFLDRAFLGALGEAVVARRLRLRVLGLAERLHQLIVDVVEHVAAAVRAACAAGRSDV